MTALNLALCLTGTLLAVDVPLRENGAADLGQLQGEWVMASRATKPVEKQRRVNDVRDFKLNIQGDRWTTTYRDHVLEATIKLDSSAEPKAMDQFFNSPNGPNGVRPKLCIYKLEGDTLTICSEFINGVRPKEFNTGDDGGSLYVYKRARK